MGCKVGEADFFCSPFCGSRHHLHQPRGAHPRLGIHDEPALLANQAIHVGRIEPNALCSCHDRIFKRHREALIQVHQSFGSVAGIDTAVPHFGAASDIGRSEQSPVVHATFGMQADAVVPFAHAFGTQAQTNGVQRALQARVGAGQLFFFEGGRRWAWREAAALAQLF